MGIPHEPTDRSNCIHQEPEAECTPCHGTSNVSARGSAVQTLVALGGEGGGS